MEATHPVLAVNGEIDFNQPTNQPTPGITWIKYYIYIYISVMYIGYIYLHIYIHISIDTVPVSTCTQNYVLVTRWHRNLNQKVEKPVRSRRV